MANEKEQYEPMIVDLTDEEGNSVPFEYLDTIPYEDAEYAVLLAVVEEDDPTDGEIAIMQILPIVGSDDEEEFITVEDEKTLSAVYEIFKERHKNDMTFED